MVEGHQQKNTYTSLLVHFMDLTKLTPFWASWLMHMAGVHCDCREIDLPVNINTYMQFNSKEAVAEMLSDLLSLLFGGQGGIYC